MNRINRLLFYMKSKVEYFLSVLEFRYYYCSQSSWYAGEDHSIHHKLNLI